MSLCSRTRMAQQQAAQMPFCPCRAGGCQEKEMVLGPRTSPAKLKGGNDGMEQEDINHLHTLLVSLLL